VQRILATIVLTMVAVGTQHPRQDFDLVGETEH
jgi:hypothetical protein